MGKMMHMKKRLGEKFKTKKIPTLLLAAAVAAVPVTGLAAVAAENIFAVTDAEVAEDGTYSSSVTVSKYKKGKLDKTYRGTVYVTVSEGKISNLTVYASDKQDRFEELLRAVRSSYIGKPASLSGAGAALDAVSSPTAKGTGNTNSEKYYISNLTDAIENAIKGAPAAASSDDEGADIADGVYTGRADMNSNNHYITLDVTVANGKISDISIKEADGDWNNLLSQVKSSYIGTKAEAPNVDAVTSATTQGYREAIAAAIKNALESAGDPGNTGGDTGEGTGDDTGGNGGDENGGSQDQTGETDGCSIVKKLKKAAKGVKTPEATFTFTLTPKDNAPQIGKKCITVNEETDLSALKADIALSNEDLEAFKDSGIYEYILTEEEGGISASAKGDMTYNTGNKSYLVKYKLWYKNGVLEPASVTMQEIINGNVKNEKTDAALFENSYTVSAGLTVSKKVEGEHADKSKSFEYSVTFTQDDANEGMNLTSTAVLKKDGTEVAAGSQLEYGTSYTFSLSDSESIYFTLPAGTDYELTEMSAENYTPSANVVADGKQTAQSAGTGKALIISSYAGENENKAEFTNTYVDNPLTGVSGVKGPLFIILPAVAGGIVLLALANKKKSAGNK